MLLGRRKLDGEGYSFIELLADKGVNAAYEAVDVADETALAKTLDNLTAPLKGIFHAAGVLDDGIILQQNWERFEKVFKPKIDGAWNLHKLTADMDLELFVLFSSISSFMGTPGQVNYAAANSFLDSLAAYRRQKGLSALSINWGPWGEVGMAADLTTGQLNDRGFEPIKPESGLNILHAVLASEYAGIAVMEVNWNRFFANYGGTPPELLSAMKPKKKADVKTRKDKAGIKKRLSEIEIEKREEFVSEHISDLVRNIMGLASDDAVEIKKGLFDMGMDSLMAVELKNQLQTDVGETLPATLSFNYPNIESLSKFILYDVLKMEKSESSEDETAVAKKEDEYDEDQRRLELEEMSEEDVEALLLKQLEMADSE